MAIKKVMRLLLPDMPAENGCDISYYQGDVDFVAMKKAGIKAVIIRAGYGSTIDKRFISYINAAIRAGLAVGVYWFIYAADRKSFHLTGSTLRLAYGLTGNMIQTKGLGHYHRPRGQILLTCLTAQSRRMGMKQESTPIRITYDRGNSKHGS